MESNWKSAYSTKNQALFVCALISATAIAVRAAPPETASDSAPISPTQDVKKPRRTRKTKIETLPLPPRLESLDVRASQITYRGGEPVFLRVSLLNKSATKADFLMLGPNVEFKIKREGKIVGLTRKGKEDSQGDKVSYRSVAIGEKFDYAVVLSRVFDLSRAGNYVVSCTKFLKNENHDPGADLVGPRIVSQNVKFSVLETDIETGKS